MVLPGARMMTEEQVMQIHEGCAHGNAILCFLHVILFFVIHVLCACSQLLLPLPLGALGRIPGRSLASFALP